MAIVSCVNHEGYCRLVRRKHSYLIVIEVCIKKLRMQNPEEPFTNLSVLGRGSESFEHALFRFM